MQGYFNFSGKARKLAQEFSAKTTGDYSADPCARKHGGNQQSVEAYKRAEPSAAYRKAQCLGIIRKAGERGATSKEIARILDVPLHTISGRLTELGPIYEGRIVNRGGRKREGAAVWVSV